jgi:2,3-bisphosphoglycerate-independent phosphoglycerate mutase
MHYIPIILLFALALIPLNVSADSAVIVVVDALGSSYLVPHEASFMDGEVIHPVDVKAFDKADAQYQLKVSVPSTEFGHAVIVTGYSNASEQTVSYYHSTIFDVLRDDGYISFGIMENGDTPEMLGELDAAVHNANESVSHPNYQFVDNGGKVPDDVIRMMKEYSHDLPDKAGRDEYASYINYNAWGLGFTRDLVRYMNVNHPDCNYVVIVNVGGLDTAGHNQGYDGYKAVISGLDDDMCSLVDACKTSGTILMVTGDHGMSFKNETARGAHASPNVAFRKESLLVPLFIYSNVTPPDSGIYGQECIAPTLFTMLEEPDTMSLSNGEPLPVKENPTLFLRSKSPVPVNVTGRHRNISATVEGIYKIAGLEKGDYTVRYGNADHIIKLSHDEVVDLNEAAQEALPVPPWMAYAATAVISFVGIAAALKLAWARK